MRKPISSAPFVLLNIIFTGYRNLDRRLMALERSKEGEMDRIRRMVLSTPIPISKSEILALMPDVSSTTAEAVLGGMAPSEGSETTGTPAMSAPFRTGEPPDPVSACAGPADPGTARCWIR